MPVNLIHSWFHRVESNWDPIPNDYAERYGEAAWQEDYAKVIDRLESFSGSLAGKRVLDLGGGPGHYSVLMAQRGAHVTWHDVSRAYQKFARACAEAQGISLDFSLGYLEDAKKFGSNSFDLVFCRMCWCYCRSDRAFAKLLYSLVKPGGIGYIECNTPAFAKPAGLRKFQLWLNALTWWKIGHPMPPHGRIAKLIQKRAIEFLELDYSSELRDVVLFAKRGADPLFRTVKGD